MLADYVVSAALLFCGLTLGLSDMGAGQMSIPQEECNIEDDATSLVQHQPQTQDVRKASFVQRKALASNAPKADMLHKANPANRIGLSKHHYISPLQVHVEAHKEKPRRGPQRWRQKKVEKQKNAQHMLQDQQSVLGSEMRKVNVTANQTTNGTWTKAMSRSPIRPNEVQFRQDSIEKEQTPLMNKSNEGTVMADNVSSPAANQSVLGQPEEDVKSNESQKDLSSAVGKIGQSAEKLRDGINEVAKTAKEFVTGAKPSAGANTSTTDMPSQNTTGKKHRDAHWIIAIVVGVAAVLIGLAFCILRPRI